MNRKFLLVVFTLTLVFACFCTISASAEESEDGDGIATLQSYAAGPILPEDHKLTAEERVYLQEFYAEQATTLTDNVLSNIVSNSSHFENAAHQMAEGARSLGFSEDHYVITLAQNTWWCYRYERNACRSELAVRKAAAEEVARKAEEEKKAKLAEEKFQEDLNILAHAVWAEVGTCPKWVMKYAASVIINRVNSNYYADTIWAVLNEPGQYSIDLDYAMRQSPSQDCWDACREVLIDGPNIPKNVMGQNGSASGDGIYTSYYDYVTGNVVYFTYVNVD